MIPIDVSATIPLREVIVNVRQGDKLLQDGKYDWREQASDNTLRAAVLLAPNVSGEVVVEIEGLTSDDQRTASHSHRVVVTPGQVAPTVRVVLLPP